MARGASAEAEGAGSATGAIVAMLIGPIVWALHFLAIYGGHAMLCARAAAIDPSAVVAVATVIAIAILVAALRFRGAAARLLRAAPAAPRSFQGRAMTLLALLSMLGIAWAGATVAALPACLILR